MTTFLSSDNPSEVPEPAKGTFGYDCSFIKVHDSETMLLGQGAGRLLISPKYQARVFTSTGGGDTGASFGWINYDAFERPLDPQINSYGGENRLSLGPQGEPYGLFFQKDASLTLERRNSPVVVGSEPWMVTGTGGDSAAFSSKMELENYAGTLLSIRVDRVIRLLTRDAMTNITGQDFHSGIQGVGYTTFQTLNNVGKDPWDEQTGMPCLRVIDRFPGSDETVVILPYIGWSKPGTTNYLGEIPGARLRMYAENLFFRADGKSRGMLGVKPSRARKVAGSYDPGRQVLTVIQFSVDPAGRYLNQDGRTDEAPFNGDGVYAYNDGPLVPGYEPFYELESVSPAAALKPMGCIHHRHTVLHYTGPEAALNPICQMMFGVSVEEVKQVLK